MSEPCSSHDSYERDRFQQPDSESLQGQRQKLLTVVSGCSSCLVPPSVIPIAEEAVRASASYFKAVINPAWEGTRSSAQSLRWVNASHMPLHSYAGKHPLTDFQPRAMENVRCQGKRAGAVLDGGSNRGRCDSCKPPHQRVRPKHPQSPY